MRFLLSSILLILLSQATLATEWDCAATEGTFTRSTDCLLSGEIALTNHLNILGVVKSDGSYPVITAASNTRHFKITSGAHKLTLKYIKMTGADIMGNSDEDGYGGSIFVYNVAATLNISDSDFFNNRALKGGAIYAKDGDPNLFFSSVNFTENHADSHGGAVYFYGGNLVDHFSTYNKNTVLWFGGALYQSEGSHSSLFNSSLVSNTAGEMGGGIFIYGSSTSSLDMSYVTLQSNKQINGGTDGTKGGGGLCLYQKVTVNIRESTIIENEATGGSTGDKHGHQILIYKTQTLIPSIAIVNTKFTHIAGNNAFYGFDGNGGGADKYVSPTTCSAQEPCSVAPFTGTCTDLGNEGAQCACADADVYAPLGTSTCLAHTTCGDQTDATTRLTDASATAAGTCAACASGSFAPDGATNCQTHFDTSGCNAERKKEVNVASETTDNSCGDTCATTQYASGTQCIDYTTTCPAGSELSAALPDAQRTCEACPIGEYKTLNDGSECLVCQDAYEVIPINATEGATDCLACNVSTEYDHDSLAHTGCIANPNTVCDQNFQLVVTAGNAVNLCEACSP